MRKGIFSTIVMLIALTSCFGQKKLPLIPYEFAGSKGFVNSNLERVTMPIYSIKDRGNYGSPYAKYAAIATRELGDVVFWYLVLCDGREIKVTDDSGFVGEDYYYSNYEKEREYAEIKSLWNLKDTYTIKDVRIQPSPSSDWIIARDAKGAGDRIINLHGDVRWSSDVRHEISDICEQDNLVFIKPNRYSERMIDGSGKYINNSEWSHTSRFSEGLFAGGKRVHSEKYPDYFFVTGDYGFYNRNGVRIIPVADYTDDYIYCAFCCGVAPCVFENSSCSLYTGVGKDSDNWALIDKTGMPIVTNISAFEIGVFCDEGSAILTMKSSEGKKQRLIDTKGKELNSYVYDWIKRPVNGYYRARRNNMDYLVSATDGKEYACIDFIRSSPAK